MNKQVFEAKRNADMADNQVAFRKLNSKLKILIDELRSIAVERGEQTHVFKSNETYHFYCECSDENCRERISLRFDEYEKAHERDDTFIIIKKHEILDIESIISIKPAYIVVQKYETPKQSNEVFHETTLDNVA